MNKGDNGKGTLYYKFHNFIRKLNPGSEAEPLKRKKKKSAYSDLDESGDTSSIRKLRHEKLDHESQLTLWRECVATRLNLMRGQGMKALLSQWDQYAEARGYDFVSTYFITFFDSTGILDVLSSYLCLLFIARVRFRLFASVEEWGFLEKVEIFKDLMLSSVIPDILKNKKKGFTSIAADIVDSFNTLKELKDSSKIDSSRYMWVYVFDLKTNLVIYFLVERWNFVYNFLHHSRNTFASSHLEQ